MAIFDDFQWILIKKYKFMGSKSINIIFWWYIEIPI